MLYVGKIGDNADGSTMLDKRYVITNGNHWRFKMICSRVYQKR